MADIETMIGQIDAGQMKQAQNEFDDIIGDKIADRLDQAKIAVSQSIFNPVEEAEDDIDDIVADLEDEMYDMEYEEETHEDVD